MKKRRLNSKNPKYQKDTKKKEHKKLVKQLICCDKGGVKAYANWYNYDEKS